MTESPQSIRYWVRRKARRVASPWAVEDRGHSGAPTIVRWFSTREEATEFAFKREKGRQKKGKAA